MSDLLGAADVTADADVTDGGTRVDEWPERTRIRSGSTEGTTVRADGKGTRMTYPPQQPGQPDPYGQQPGPYGQQPDPYGQQPGPYGQPGPQHYGQQPPQPGPYGQQDPYGQQQFGQQPYGGQQFGQQPYGAHPGGPGGPGGEPPKKKTGLIAGISAGAVVLLAGVFAFTAWVAPGFLLDDEEQSADGNNNASPATSQSGEPTSSGSETSPETETSESAQSGERAPGAKTTPEATAQVIVAGFNAGDRQAVSETICLSKPQDVPPIPDGVQIEIAGSAQVSGDAAKVPAKNATQNRDYFIVLKNEGGAWCYLGDQVTS